MYTKTSVFWIVSVAIMVLFALTAFMPFVSAAEVYPGGSIQAAINAATPGETITVHDGDYKENLWVHKSNIVIRSANGSSVTFITSNQEDTHVINITDQTNVTLEGFEIRGAYGWDEAVAGIYMENASKCTISNISVSNITSEADEFVYGISLSSSHNNAFNSNIFVTDITTNRLDRRAYGIHLSDSSNNNTFSGSTVVSNIESRWFIAYGIHLSDSSNNIFNGSTTVSTIYAYLRPYGIHLSDSSNNIFNGSTTVSAISAELDPHGIYLSSSSNNNTFSASTTVSNLTGNDVYGIYLDSSNHNRFSASTTVSNISATNFAFGILLEDPSNNNTFSANITVSNISARYAFGIYLDSSNHNRFSANTAVSNISATNFAFGIDLYSSHNNRFSASTTISHIDGGLDAFGIALIDSNNNTFTDFTITGITSGGGSTSYGIYLWGEIPGKCCGNVFSGGSIYSSGDPRIDYAVWLDNCTHNTINTSDIVENGHGFWLNQSDNNTIERNMIVNNTALYVSGVNLTLGSDNNEIHENCFYDNGLEHQAWDDGMNNDWDSNFWSDYPQWGVYDIAGGAGSQDHSTLRECGELSNIIDTDSPANPYPSIAGTHNGTITPFSTINVSTLYTYPCPGTGGHTESIKLYENDTLIASGVWDGYQSNWHYLSLTSSITLQAGHVYNYTIVTGSYPQIHHTNALPTANGWINCTGFVDANGKTYCGWIPAIRLF